MLPNPSHDAVRCVCGCATSSDAVCCACLCRETCRLQVCLAAQPLSRCCSAGTLMSLIRHLHTRSDVQRTYCLHHLLCISAKALAHLGPAPTACALSFFMRPLQSFQCVSVTAWRWWPGRLAASKNYKLLHICIIHTSCMTHMTSAHCSHLHLIICEIFVNVNLFAQLCGAGGLGG